MAPVIKQLRRAISVEYDIGLFAFSAKKVFLVAGGLEGSIVHRVPITMVAATVKRQFVGYFPGACLLSSFHLLLWIKYEWDLNSGFSVPEY